ncbi:hypothetical protein E2C01_063068 [Portunus trituberculatus]|uniref:Uncharacterized protein n=1 Tax=Portunus trituberculatus TaxID=210409 RepID=A0A5B7HJA1_PORTR|nr:hypothetical protein [Portunus trituberculatus]
MQGAAWHSPITPVLQQLRVTHSQIYINICLGRLAPVALLLYPLRALPISKPSRQETKPTLGLWTGFELVPLETPRTPKHAWFHCTTAAYHGSKKSHSKNLMTFTEMIVKLSLVSREYP